MADGTLRIVLGDQLTPEIAALDGGDPDRDVVLMAEVRAEATYVRHHPKKIAFVFAAMRHFAEALRQQGWTVDYVDYDAPGNSGSLAGEAERAVRRHKLGSVVVTEPGEWRLRRDMDGWQAACGVPVTVLEDGRFLCSHDRFRRWAAGRKSLRMEYFYREMRREHGILLEPDGSPVGGRWNFDAENRKPPAGDLDPPPLAGFPPDPTTEAVLDLVERTFVGAYADGGHFGDLRPFRFAVTRQQAEDAFDRFVRDALPRFGDFQDAMVAGQDTLFHSVIGLYLNAGLLDPLAVIRRVEQAWRQGAAPLNAAEGYIRQILGWREYVRGLYWLKMPHYAQTNALAATRPLPDFYWTGETDLNCLRQVIGQTRREAYAHHIQRLMVTGNFALLIGAVPDEVCEWYLSVYADAYEWVELPNTHGMALFADGGVMASKPYAASGAYIDRMSDYCGSCRYDVRQKTGRDACPFNLLYWDFLIRNRDRLGGNPRLGMIYKTLDRMDTDRVRTIRADATRFLDTLTPKHASAQKRAS